MYATWNIFKLLKTYGKKVERYVCGLGSNSFKVKPVEEVSAMLFICRNRGEYCLLRVLLRAVSICKFWRFL